ncbi:hypothetical protein HPULCUR_004480 [Helicostylum pulchrum]|uniref:Uncharacterized protein n=1 Tax=Helicostylum pulchrum TaxID=562976 RepID=A0ABP9XWB8_9FUNG
MCLQERILSPNQTSCKVDYNSIWPDQIDEKACWFRNYFVGKQYVTFIGPIMDDEKDMSLISVVKEYEKGSKQKAILQYRIIVRTKQVFMQNMQYYIYIYICYSIPFPSSPIFYITLGYQYEFYST